MDILIIEDELEIQFSLKELLEFKGHSVYAVNNGKDAMKALKLIVPDLIITDILMPEMDGYEVLLKLKKEEKDTYGKIPVIVVSALAAHYQIQTAEKFGADYYLTKPFSADELFQAIQAVTKK